MSRTINCLVDRQRCKDNNLPSNALIQRGAGEPTPDIMRFCGARYSSWPFSYQSIFDQAFAEYPAKRVADLCTRQIGKSDATLRIGREIVPTAAQQPLLQKLGTAGAS